MMAGVRAPDRAKSEPPVVRERTTAEEGGTEFVFALESVSRGIRDPVAKLRFIRASLARYQHVDRCVKAVPWALLRRWLYRWLSIEGLRHLLTANPLGAPVPVSPATRLQLSLSRGITLAVALGLLIALGAGAYRASRPGPASATPVMAAARTLLPTVAESLPPLPAGVRPAAVWLVEKGEGWEQYSNGLRIDAGFAVAGEPRRYRVFESGVGLRDGLNQKPVGILFHTSESDIWPLEASFNENLRDSSHRLLRYVQRLRLYNYLIDRFGRVFRVVEEDGRANHAGNSVWARGDQVYLNLNNAFLAVCFETRWEGGHALPITQAQLAAGRNLTDYLRQRWDVAPEMCVTHGLTSVNPKKHLIGHHVDWARGFPFEAFGLPDQYIRPAPSVAIFGFGYDDDFIKIMGEPWAGVRDAERALAEEARRVGRPLEEVRRERRDLYDRWLAEQARDEEARAASSRSDRAAARGAQHLPPEPSLAEPRSNRAGGESARNVGASTRSSGPTRRLAPPVGPRSNGSGG